MLDPKFVQPRDPLLQLGAVGAAEADVVEADAMFAEILIGGRAVVLMDAEQRAAIEQPHLMPVAGIVVLVGEGVGAEKTAVPGAADVEVAHRDRDVVEGGKSHGPTLRAVPSMGPLAEYPPSTGSAAPVINEASSLARNSAAAASSAGSPQRAIGVGR